MIRITSLPLNVILYLWAFWALYVMVMGLYRAHLAKRLGWASYCLGSPFLVTGLVLDVVTNLTLACLVFREKPYEWLLTTRLIRLKKDQTNWNGRAAKWICDALLDPFDPNGIHCQELGSPA